MRREQCVWIAPDGVRVNLMNVQSCYFWSSRR